MAILKFTPVGIMKLMTAVLIVLSVSSCSTSTPQQAFGKPMHHTTEGFRNYPDHKPQKFAGISFVLRQVWYSMFPLEMNIDYTMSEADSLAMLASMGNQDSITWLGHASFLIRINGKNILLDPHLTKYAAPVAMMGPWRFSDPGISIDNLPPIDAVVISHNHYDHQSQETLDSLPNKQNIQVVVPLNMGSFFADIGYTKIRELDWHESFTLDEVVFNALPAVHHSGRALGDQDEALWASWLIQDSEKKVYFAGDTAYSDAIFKNIGNQFGSIDWALVPIGAYQPVEILRANHLIPSEAVLVGKDVNAKNALGMHWGALIYRTNHLMSHLVYSCRQGAIYPMHQNYGLLK